MIEILKSKIGKRKQASYVVTQCDDRNSARKFWQGRLTHSKWANVFIGLMHIYNPEIRIYESVTNTARIFSNFVISAVIPIYKKSLL